MQVPLETRTRKLFPARCGLVAYETYAARSFVLLRRTPRALGIFVSGLYGGPNTGGQILTDKKKIFSSFLQHVVDSNGTVPLDFINWHHKGSGGEDGAGMHA